MRDPSWAEDPERAGCDDAGHAAVRTGSGPPRTAARAPRGRPDRATIRFLARLAQGGARGREKTKSKMALMAHALKLGYRHLGAVLAESGRLPDADLVFFFDRAELARVVGTR